MKKLIGVALVIAVGAAGFLISREISLRRAALEAKEAAAEIAAADPRGTPQVIAIPETLITLRHPLQWKDAAGNAVIVLEAGTQLVSESTQGLDYIVTRDRRTFRVHCDDAYESHARFTDGRAEQLALKLAAEIRAEGKVPTNERIVSRAQDALEEKKLDPAIPDPATLVDSMQRVLILHPPVDRDGEAPEPLAADKPN